jgi:hypothetical protein
MWTMKGFLEIVRQNLEKGSLFSSWSHSFSLSRRICLSSNHSCIPNFLVSQDSKQHLWSGIISLLEFQGKSWITRVCEREKLKIKTSKASSFYDLSSHSSFDSHSYFRWCSWSPLNSFFLNPFLLQNTIPYSLSLSCIPSSSFHIVKHQRWWWLSRKKNPCRALPVSEKRDSWSLLKNKSHGTLIH